MPKDILGSGWRFPISTNNKEQIAISQYEEKIAQAIMIILSTAKGERVMRPDFGCDIHAFTFAIINTATLTQIKSAVTEALILWEPRIEVADVQTFTGHIDRGILEIKVIYKVRYTNTEHNIVYPFYLESGGSHS